MVKKFHICRKRGAVVGTVPKIVCINCGREIRGIKAAKADGWLVEGDGKIFCCCVCKGEYSNKNKKSKKK